MDDNGVYPKTVFLITPGLYILVGLTTILSFLFCIYLFRKKGIDYRYSLFFIGIILSLPNLISFSNVNYTAITYVILTWALASLIFLGLVFLVLYIKNNVFNEIEKFNFSKFIAKMKKYKINFSIVLAHLFDASTTYIVAVLYIIDQYFDDLTIKNLLKLTVFVLGLAPGLRNILTMALATI